MLGFDEKLIDWVFFSMGNLMVYVSWILLEVDDKCYPMFVVLPNFNGGDVWRCPRRKMHRLRCVAKLCHVVPGWWSDRFEYRQEPIWKD